MKQDKTGFSIIIPTYSAAVELDLTLTSLEKNSRLDNELIIVVDALKDGGYDDEVITVLEEHDREFIKNEENRGPYGSWNRGARQAKRNWLCFATDDQYFAPGWDEALWQHKDKKVLLTGTVVEPGIISVWEDNIEKDFGHNPLEFEEEEFIAFSRKKAQDRVVDGGFFIPMVVTKQAFGELDGWPMEGEFGTRDAPANDIAFVEDAKQHGLSHKRSLASFSYHFQGSSWRRKKKAQGISVAMISRPNEAKIEPVLASVSDWVDEIVVVVDSDEKVGGSTVEAAQKYQAKIFFHAMDDYSSQKNFAIEHCRGEWILSLDSDEVVSTGLAEELQQVTDNLSYNGYLVPRENIIFGKKIKGAGWYPDYQLRFFVKGYGQFSEIIHERIQVNGSVGKLKNPLIHYNYRSVSGFIARLNRYTDLEAEKLAQQDYRFRTIDLLKKPYREFISRFFAKKGWQDGLHGLALSLLMSFYSLMIYLKTWEKEGFAEKELDYDKLARQTKHLKKDGLWWWYSFKAQRTKGFKELFYKVLAKIWQKL